MCVAVVNCPRLKSYVISFDCLISDLKAQFFLFVGVVVSFVTYTREPWKLNQLLCTDIKMEMR